MKTSPLTWIILLAFLFVTGCDSEATASPTPDKVEAEEESAAISESGKLETFQFTSQALSGNLFDDPETRKIYVYLPPGYAESDERYPVVFALHGYLEDPTWMTGMGPQLDSLVAAGEAKKMILVFPDGDNRLGGSFYLSSSTIGDYETYIAQELVEYVDSAYRSIANRDSRGIAGCSMGGNGAMHLAFTFPETFSSAAAVSGGYAYENYPQVEEAPSGFSESKFPDNLDDAAGLPWYLKVSFAMAAGAAPNPGNSPFYFDLPFELVSGTTQIVPEVIKKIGDANVIQDVYDYLDQPLRLRGAAIYHGIEDVSVPLEMASVFSEILEELNVEHEYIEVEDGHCDPSWDYSDALRFLSANLIGE